eukprot:TRINITY_DN9608_c0_g1_i4.p1 TRINITY_DN9608_c0_g1~~TRINITY_DN9608_c0_g1_i4.p1  ORF type:complete len:328 (-),score=79.90 TRINITY_DN9608_c0_g1_i4:305-1141(-)
MNHCASIIQSYYRKHKERTKNIQRARGRKSVGNKNLTGQERKEYNGKQRKQSSKNERELVSPNKRHEDLQKHIKEDFKNNNNCYEPNTKLPEEKPIKAVGEYKYDAEAVPVMEEAFKTPANSKVTKKSFLKRKEVYDPLKSIKESKKVSVQGAKSAIEVSRKDSIRGAQEDQSPKAGQSEMEDEARTKRDYLKRRSKKVEAKRLDWQRVTRRIDCWNQRQRSPARSVLFHKKRESDKDVKASEAQVQEKVRTRFGMKQLGRVYLQYHGDGEGIFLVIS